MARNKMLIDEHGNFVLPDGWASEFGSQSNDATIARIQDAQAASLKASPSCSAQTLPTEG
jgi:hypothetical protein